MLDLECFNQVPNKHYSARIPNSKDTVENETAAYNLFKNAGLNNSRSNLVYRQLRLHHNFFLDYHIAKIS